MNLRIISDFAPVLLQLCKLLIYKLVMNSQFCTMRLAGITGKLLVQKQDLHI